MLLGLGLLSPPFHTQFPIPIPNVNLKKCKSFRLHPQQNKKFSIFPLRSLKARRPNKASENGGRGDKVLQSNNGGGDEKQGGKEEDGERPRFNLRWLDLFLDPDPDNIVAVGLTGLLAWASVQVLWQLFFISTAILAAAIKYSFIAALLIFILITLL